jgi:lipopolysaccharide export system protein LptC
MTAFGNVVLLTQGNCRITTEELHYDPSTRRIWSDVQSRFEIAGRVTTANSFRADDQFNNFEAEGMTGAIPRGCGVS